MKRHEEITQGKMFNPNFKKKQSFYSRDFFLSFKVLTVDKATCNDKYSCQSSRNLCFMITLSLTIMFSVVKAELNYWNTQYNTMPWVHLVNVTLE